MPTDDLIAQIEALPFSDDEMKRDTMPIGTAAAMRDYRRRVLAVLRAEPSRSSPNPDLWTVLANDIRTVDGNHDLGAGELAARLVERGWRLGSSPDLTGLDPD